MACFRLLILLAVSVSLCGSCLPRFSGPRAPVPADGVLDLRAWDFSRDGSLRLDGPWQFYWNQLLIGDDFKSAPGPSGLLNLPGNWNRFMVAGQPIGADGFATLRLVVLRRPGPEVLALGVSDIFSAYSLFVNGRRVGGRGQATDRPETTRPLVAPDIYEFAGEADRLEIVLFVANFHHFRGLVESITLGQAAQVRESRERRIAFEMFVIGALIIMGVYHLFLYLLRTEDRSPLYFGIFCLMVATYTLLTGMRYLIHLIPEAGHRFHWTLNFLGFTIAPGVFLLFLRSIFPGEIKRGIVWGMALPGAALVLLTFFPPRLFTEALAVYSLYIALSGLYGIYGQVLAIARRREGSFLFFPGFLIFFAGIINDLLYAQEFISTGYYSGFGLVVFIFFQAAMLSMRFARAFRTVENLTGELEIKNVELSRVDRLKDEFLASTSHELRTPLNGIIGIADSLLEGAAGPLSDTARRNLQLIVSSGDRLSGLINDILDFQKLRNNEIQLLTSPVDLGQVVDVVLSVSRPLIGPGKRLTLRGEIPADLPPVEADENRLQQILHNLIGNAIKFTPEGEVVLSAGCSGANVQIKVRDTGIGIPGESLDLIFLSFTQADSSIEREFGGTGLGLSITKKLVELHGGTIGVESRPGQGSTFYFTLPAATGRADGARTGPHREHLAPNIEPSVLFAPSAANESETPPPGRTILVVDDEPVNRQILVNLLSVRRYRVLEAADGEAALRILERTTPDAVLLDIMMPRMNGYEVCRKIRQSHSAVELPVIFLSAKNQVEDMIAGLESGGNDFLSKPFSSLELLARVQTQTNLKFVHREAMRLRKQLLDQEKLAAIGSMAAGIVHDFKTPVSIIKGYAEMADDDLIRREERSQFLQIVTRQADLLADMAQDVLEFSRGSFEIKPRPIEAGEFLAMARQALLPYFAAREIECQVATDRAGRLLIDPERFLRAVLNLASNAGDVMKPGDCFSVELQAAGDRFLLTLRDSGPGIPETIREHVFEPFVTGGKTHGTGLGLAITRSIVQAHGGTIRFETETGRGTTFFIDLPGEKREERAAVQA